VIAQLLEKIISALASWLMAKLLEFIHGQEKKAKTEKDIDHKLKDFKEAYKEAFDGNEITPEQRQKLQKAISDFIRSPSGSGL
jgi:uncharacterized protein YgfB (UPF0149 family)